MSCRSDTRSPASSDAGTRERWRNRLPHWEVDGRPHFITVRCAGSLPAEALARVREIHVALQQIAPGSPQFVALQRQYFLTCERYLDRNEGFAPFEAQAGWRVPHAVVMPNHVHFVLVPAREAPVPLRQTLRQWKGRVARETNLALGRRGAFWQTDWFDRWSRTAAEERRCADYIRQNPVKAGLVQDWRDWPWTRSEPFDDDAR